MSRGIHQSQESHESCESSKNHGIRDDLEIRSYESNGVFDLQNRENQKMVIHKTIKGSELKVEK